ncbi:Transcriptional regulator of nonfermentable carbon utilization, partial [Spiromyces aspiralis]
MPIGRSTGNSGSPMSVRTTASSLMTHPVQPIQKPPSNNEGPAVHGLNPTYLQNPAQVYNSVTEPHRYSIGFHHLFNYIKVRMKRSQMMQICRALAHCRPSLIALLRNLTEEDLMYMEKSFQRALLEYKKLIGFSGTPTVVWRRTGEIVLVGTEFCLLTGWQKDRLMGTATIGTTNSRGGGGGGGNGNDNGESESNTGKSRVIQVGRPMLIFQLIDNDSTVRYWDLFAVHAFENSNHSVLTTCTLISPDGSRHIP